MEIHLFYGLCEIFDNTLIENPSPRKYIPEIIVQGTLSNAFTSVDQLAMLRRIAGAPIEGES